MEVIKLFDIPKEVINDNERQRRVYSVEGISPTILSRSDNAKIMEVKVIGQMDNTIDHTFESANRVYDVGGVSPTINTCGGGGLQPKILEDAQAIRMVRTEEGKALRKEYESGAIHHGFNEHREMELRTDGVSNTLSTVQKDNYICEKSIVAMRGRNPDNPSDRTVGATTEQRLEPNSQGICNTLTSVQKDNLVMEKVVIDDTYANRQPRVYEDYSPALRSERDGLKTIETISTKGKQIEVASTILAGYERTNMTGFNADNGVVEQAKICLGGLQEHQTPRTDGISPTLTSAMGMGGGQTPIINDCQYRIRKLTPKECWRLMDFTDEDFEKAAQVNSNTQLYKQAGNSIVKNVLVEILGQMIPGKEDVYKEIQNE